MEVEMPRKNDYYLNPSKKLLSEFSSNNIEVVELSVMKGVWDRHLRRNKNTKRDGSETIPQSCFAYETLCSISQHKGT